MPRRGRRSVVSELAPQKRGLGHGRCRPSLRGGHESHQLGKPLLMDTASLREREPLVVPLLWSEKRAYLIIHATKAGRSIAVFESAHGAVALFNPSVVLLNGLITNDKFCMSRTNPSRVRWARRPSQRRALPPATARYLHNDPEHGGGGHETPVAHPASVPRDRGWRTAVGSGLPTPAPLEHAQRVPSSLSAAAIDATTEGGS
jgi:hypothetical protein